jgi:hypothetical protein
MSVGYVAVVDMPFSFNIALRKFQIYVQLTSICLRNPHFPPFTGQIRGLNGAKMLELPFIICIVNFFYELRASKSWIKTKKLEVGFWGPLFFGGHQKAGYALAPTLATNITAWGFSVMP